MRQSQFLKVISLFFLNCLIIFLFCGSIVRAQSSCDPNYCNGQGACPTNQCECIRGTEVGPPARWCCDCGETPPPGGGVECGDEYPRCSAPILNPQANTANVDAENNYYWNQYSSSFNNIAVKQQDWNDWVYKTTSASDTETHTVVHDPGTGYNREGVMGYFWDNNGGATRYQLYRCKNKTNNERMLSVVSNCEDPANYNQEGVLGFVYPDAGSGLHALYRCKKGSDHMTSASQAECTGAGYTVEGALGYAGDSQVSGTLPSYRCYNPTSGDHMDAWRGDASPECKWSEIKTVPATYVVMSPILFSFSPHEVVMTNENIDNPCRNISPPRSDCINLSLNSGPDSGVHGRVRFRRADGKKIARVEFRYKIMSGNYILNLDYGTNDGIGFMGWMGWSGYGYHIWHESGVVGNNEYVFNGPTGAQSYNALLDFGADWVGFGISARHRDGEQAIQVWDVKLISYDQGTVDVADLDNVTVYNSSWDDGKWGTKNMRMSKDGGGTYDWGNFAWTDDTLPLYPNSWNLAFNYHPLQNYDFTGSNGTITMQYRDTCSSHISTCGPYTLPFEGEISGKVYSSSEGQCSGTDPMTGPWTVYCQRTDQPGGKYAAQENGANYTCCADANCSSTELPFGTYQISIDVDLDQGWTVVCPSGGISSVTLGQGAAIGPTFYAWQGSEAWFQTQGASVHAQGDLSSPMPIGVGSTHYFSMDLFNFPGVVSYGGDSDFGSGSVSSKGWLANTTFSPVKQTSSYFYEKLGSPTEDNFSCEPSCPNPPAGTTIYYSTNDVTIGNDWNIPSGRKAIVLIGNSSNPKNLNISKKITVATGGFLMFVVSGNISIEGVVGDKSAGAFTGTSAHLQGIYLADGSISTNSDSNPSGNRLVVGGIFSARSGITLGRDLKGGGVTNLTTPAELFIFRPDLVLNAPRELWSSKISWMEVAP